MSTYPTKNTTVSLGEPLDAFAASLVACGRYGSVSEVGRAGLPLLEAREMKMTALRAATEDGATSPVSEGYSLTRVMDQIDRKAK